MCIYRLVIAQTPSLKNWRISDGSCIPPVGSFEKPKEQLLLRLNVWCKIVLFRCLKVFRNVGVGTHFNKGKWFSNTPIAMSSQCLGGVPLQCILSSLLFYQRWEKAQLYEQYWTTAAHYARASVQFLLGYRPMGQQDNVQVFAGQGVLDKLGIHSFTDRERYLVSS